MSSITLRLPDALQARLQSVAAANHRSVNKQATVLLEQALQITPASINTEAQTRYEALMAIVQKARTEPLLDTRTDNQIMAYGDDGLPAR